MHERDHETNTDSRASYNFLVTGKDSDGEDVRIFYQLHGQSFADRRADDTRPKVLLIMGLAASGDGWQWTLQDLLQPHEGLSIPAIVACTLDNRGVGRSSAPKRRRDYSTSIMAPDALAVLDHLGWQKVHVVGFSMGGMISCKLAAMAAPRIATLTLLSATGGGWQAIPTTWTGLWLLLRGARADTPEKRAEVDLKLHFSDFVRKQMVEVPRAVLKQMHSMRRSLQSYSQHWREPTKAAAASACIDRHRDDNNTAPLRPRARQSHDYQGAASTSASNRQENALDEEIRRMQEESQRQGLTTAPPPPQPYNPASLRQLSKSYRALRVQRHALLFDEYTRPSDGGGGQSQHGLQGQLHAVWMHKVTDDDVHNITAGANPVPVVVMHGDQDLLADWRYGQRLAKRLHAPFLLLPGAHFIPRECGHEINQQLELRILRYDPSADRGRHLWPTHLNMDAMSDVGTASVTRMSSARLPSIRDAADLELSVHSTTNAIPALAAAST